MFKLNTAPAIYQYLSVLVHLFKYFILTFYYSHSTRLLAATTLRNVLGTKNLAEILSERETISQVMQNALDEATDPWGVKVIRNDHITLKELRKHQVGVYMCKKEPVYSTFYVTHAVITNTLLKLQLNGH